CNADDQHEEERGLRIERAAARRIAMLELPHAAPGEGDVVRDCCQPSKDERRGDRDQDWDADETDDDGKLQNRCDGGGRCSGHGASMKLGMYTSARSHCTDRCRARDEAAE